MIYIHFCIFCWRWCVKVVHEYVREDEFVIRGCAVVTGMSGMRSFFFFTLLADLGVFDIDRQLRDIRIRPRYHPPMGDWVVIWWCSNTWCAFPSFLIRSVLTSSTQHLSRTHSPSLSTLMCPRNSFKQTLPSSTSRTLTELIEAVMRILADIPLVTFRQLSLPLYPFESDNDGSVLWVEAKAHTWSRSARRKNKNKLTTFTPLLNPPLQVVIQMNVNKLAMDWIRGCSADRVLFDGFWGYVSRKVRENFVMVWSLLALVNLLLVLA